jgi:PAS domain S-box-containing protein
MKRYIVSATGILLALLSCIALCGAGQRVVRVGAFNYYPAIFKDSDGVIKGFYVDALADLAQRENIRFEYVYGSWNEGLERIQSGEVDVLTSVAVTPDRAQFLDFAATPLLTVWGELYAPLASEIDGIRGVQGKRIAVMRGDFNARHFMELVKKFDISCEFVELPGFEDVFKAVAEKKVDAGVVNNTYGVASQKEYGLRSTGVVFNPFDIFFAVAKGKNKDLLALLESYLTNWRHQPDSPYNSARQKWSHGNTGTLQVIPSWLVKSSVFLGALLLASAFFILLLKQQIRKATADVMEREARFRSYIDSSPEGILITDENGRYVEVNPAASRISGYPEVELLQKHLHEILPPESIEPALRSLDQLKQQGSSSVELEFLHKDGSRHWWSVEAVKLSETRYLGFVKDISEQKWIEQTQQFLAQCGYRHPEDNFFESLAVYLARTLQMEFVCIDRLLGDGLTAQTLAVYHDGVFEVNAEYTLKDTPCGDVVGNEVCCFPERVCQLFPRDQVLQDLRAESYIGATLWGHNGQPIGLIAIIGRNPLNNHLMAESMMKLVAVRAAGELERLDTEAALRASEEKFKAMAETIPLAIYLSTGMEQVSQYINPTMVKLFGYTMDDIPNVEQWWPLAYPDEPYRRQVSEEWDRRVRRAIETQLPIEPMEVVVTCKDGSHKNISWGFIPLGDKNYAFGVDLTERLQAEEELLKKNAEIEQFIYAVSHDLRSPLVTIKTFMGYLEKDMSDGNQEQLTQDMQFIHSAADKMKLLLDELLEFSRVGRIETTPVRISLSMLVAEVLDTLAGVISERNIDIRLPETDLLLYGDHPRLCQIWQNLIENAIKYSHHDSITRVELGAQLVNGESIFFVKDNGIGIEPPYHSKVFGIFEKLDPKSPGAGLGLSMARRIVEKSGGRIWVESEGSGTGSCFRFTLPESSLNNEV